MKFFRANAVSSVELPESATFTVVLAEELDGGERLELQRALSFDEQDRRLGMDTYCLCTEAGCVYGGVASWTVSADALELRLEEQAAKMLGVDGGFRVSFPPERRQVLREGLERVLG